MSQIGDFTHCCFIVLPLAHALSEFVFRIISLFPHTTLVTLLISPTPKSFFKFMVHSQTFEKKSRGVWHHTKKRHQIPCILTWNLDIIKNSGKTQQARATNQNYFFRPGKKANFLFHNIDSPVAHKARTRVQKLTILGPKCVFVFCQKRFWPKIVKKQWQ